MTDPRAPVAFIGLGLMGAHMAGHILAAGHPLHVYNRTRAKAEGLLARGATWHDDPGSAAAKADVVITMVGLPKDVEEIYLSSRGIIAQARPGAILIDMTTSSPSLAKRIAAAARARGAGAIDAPVSGGDIGARDAKLSIMIGGEEADVAAVTPILQLMGTNIRRQGVQGRDSIPSSRRAMLHPPNPPQKGNSMPGVLERNNVKVRGAGEQPMMFAHGYFKSFP
ncbi:NAD(P)-dependent oxidoreductase [Bradyrhizobium sp. STM 3566]|uniref:NAD(P)-dependent oxidoreductase n=1 Tax=Bradyrhizobium sp. STM 3566 TaxID=578928 RepID=UPI00388F6879